MSLLSLLERAKNGEALSRTDLESVRSILTRPVDQADPYTALHILWKCRDLESKPLFMASLESADEMVRRLALQALAGLWPSEEIFERIEGMLVSDPSAFVRMAAATCMGDLGAQLATRRSQAARGLLTAFQAGERLRDPEWESCYEGLLNLVGVPPSDRPLASRPLAVVDIDARVLAQVRRLAAEGPPKST